MEIEVREARGAVLVRLRVKPSARRTHVAGTHGAALKVEVQAAPERGKANAAVCRLIADILEVPVSCVVIAAGATAQDKTVAITGTDAATVRRRLELSLEGRPGG